MAIVLFCFFKIRVMYHFYKNNEVITLKKFKIKLAFLTTTAR